MLKHQRLEVPTKVLEPTSLPCPVAVRRLASMARRREAWTAAGEVGTRHQVQTWKGWTAEEQADQTEPPAAESPWALVQMFSWTSDSSRPSEGYWYGG
jgi:hypothetical protein